jgi:LPXTG-site transpeptidase (sortase) family protein
MRRFCKRWVKPAVTEGMSLAPRNAAVHSPGRSLLLLAALVLACAPASTLVAPTTSPTESPAAPLTQAATAAPTPTPTVDGMHIRIPRLGIDLPLKEGDIGRDVPNPTSAGATPEGAAFHLPGTAIPGHGSNAYIYAHARVGMFLALWQAKVGDEVDIETPGAGTLRYTVSEIHPSVSSSDVSWVQPTDDERVTLQTSTGPTPAYPRFIVVATRLSA